MQTIIGRRPVSLLGSSYRIISCLAAVAAVAGCGGSAAMLALAGCDGGSKAPMYPAGLTRTQHVTIPNDADGTPHGTSLLVDSDENHLLIADSFGGIAAYDPTLGSRAFHSYTMDSSLGCYTIARHAGSHTLYCDGLDVTGVALLDAQTGAIRSSNQAFKQGPGHRNILVVGDSLWGARAEGGIDRFPINADGTLGMPVSVVTTGTFQQLGYDGSTLYAASTGRGLVTVDPMSGALTDVVPLTGPVIRMHVKNGRAAIALGSQGAVVVDLASKSVVGEVHPQCVVTSADVDGDVLVAGCYTGVIGYDLVKKRVFGFAQAAFNAIDVILSGTTLTVLDWWYLDQYTVNPAGSAARLDAPNGYALQPGQGIDFNVFNHGDLTLHMNGQAIPPNGKLKISVPPGNDDTTVNVLADEGGSDDAEQVKVSRAAKIPSLGQAFPFTGVAGKLFFTSPGTCSVQWPELDDLAWLTSQGKAPGGEPPVIMVNDNTTTQVDSWIGTDMPLIWSPLQTIALGTLVPGSSGYQAYEDHLDPGRYMQGGDDEAEFWLDMSNSVTWFERVYTGAYSRR